MPDAAVVDTPRTGATNGAGAPPGASSTPPEAPPAKADSKPGTPPAASAQAPAKPADSPKDEPKGPNGWIPKSRLDEVIAKRDEANGKLQKFEEKGIYDEETADQILAQVDELETLQREMREDPVAFATRWHQASPETYGHFFSYAKTQGAEAERAALSEMAQTYRSQGKEAEADFLEAIVAQRKQKSPQSAPAQAAQPRTDTGQDTQRFSDFHEDVKADVNAGISRIIGELTADVKLEPKDKERFDRLVRSDLIAALNADQRFMQGLNRFYDPRNGYTRDMRSQAVKAYEKRLRVGGLIENAVKENLSLFTAKAATDSTNRTKVPAQAAQNREAGPGPAAAGVVTQEERAAQKAAIMADYDSGKISSAEKNSRLLGLPRIG